MKAVVRRSVAIAIVLLVVAAVFVGARFRLTTDISEFLPTGSDRERSRVSQAVADSEASRTIMLTIEADDTAHALALSAAFEAQLRSDPALMEALSFIEAGPPQGIETALWELYHPRRLSFVAPDEAAAREAVSDAGLQRAAQDLRSRLASPLSTLVTRAAPDDPLLSIPRLFERVQDRRADALATIAGRWVAQERFAVVLIGTRASAFDAPAQQAIRHGLDAAVARLRGTHDFGSVESSGLARFSIRVEQTIKADIERITAVSLIGLTVLCVVVLQSFRLALLTLVPIACAMLGATAISLALDGVVHGLTLAFGASLIGVCVDYVVHFYVHHIMHPDPAGPRATLQRIWPAIRLGAATTAVGFAVMAGSSFPGLRQVAIFASVGVTVAVLSTRVLLPGLMPRAPSRSALRDRLAQAVVAVFFRLRRRPRVGFVLIALSLAVSLGGAGAVHWADNLNDLDRLAPELLEEDQRVRQRVARFDQGRFIVAVGHTDEQALQVNDAVADALHHAIEAGEVRAGHGIATLVPSAARQARVAAVLYDAPRLRPQLERALRDAGFHERLFEPFFTHLRTPAPAPLTFDDLMASPAAPLVRAMRIQWDDRVGYVTLMRGVEDPAALAERFGAIDGVLYIDQQELMTSAMRSYRERAVQLLGVGLLAVLLLLGARYRSLRVTVAVMTPAILAAGLTVATVALLGRSLDLIGLTAILMVLSIGVDYGVFLAETRVESDAHLPATGLGLLVCWASTVLGFGVLAFSDHPTMNTIGVIAAVGVSASLLLAPTALAVLPAPKEPR